MRRALLLPLLALASCTTGGSAPAAPSGPDLTLDDVVVRHLRGGKLNVVVRTPHLEVERFSGNLHAVDAGVFVPRGEVSLTLSEVNGNLQSGVFDGQRVTLSAPDGTHAESGRVTWLSKEGEGGRVTSDAGIALSRPGLEHHATGFTLDPATERAEFTGPRTVVSSPQ